jgi:hypothetical protein
MSAHSRLGWSIARRPNRELDEAAEAVDERLRGFEIQKEIVRILH